VAEQVLSLARRWLQSAAMSSASRPANESSITTERAAALATAGCRGLPATSTKLRFRVKNSPLLRSRYDDAALGAVA